MSHTKQLIFAMVLILVPVQPREFHPELSLQSWKKRNVTTLGPFLSRHTEILKVRYGDRLLPVFGILHRLFQR